MTGKRFKTLFDNVQDGNLTIIHDVDKEITYTLNQTAELLNNFHEENQQLRKSLKRELMAMSGNLCDACKHEEEDNTNNWLVGIDYDVKCNKGHEILLDDEEQECDDFELKIGDVDD